MASSVVLFDTLRTTAFGSITTTYTPVGSIITHQISAMRIINETAGNLFFSFDGINDQMYLLAGTSQFYPFAALSGVSSDKRVSGSQALYVRYSTAPTSGGVYLEIIYQKGQ